ncbi:haloperoxidase [Bacillus sp. FJAT-18017]|uniref:alpha/beta fold hydrolase n=1 Tax=Bacillus sp. FJAT-18017 TaxID=1705566 RepID=UPI0006B02C81|nr:alpha/beta hydrolase [Bacillus sp. FJAT-18017]ALC91320.1 haloperoxidase [Bacillus sp. FJAT-18017]
MTSRYGKYIEVEPGVELFVQDNGSGEPIVFIPGFTFTTEVFSEQLEHFSKTNRTIILDPRSHGRSSMSLHGNDYVTHGTDLAKVLEALDVKNATLIGWSFGALTIWEYVKQFGTENVKSLVFVDMSPKSLSVHEGDWVEGSLNDIAAAYNAYLRNPQGQREFITGYTTGVMVQRELKEEELTWIVEQSMKTPYYIAANLFTSGMFSDYREEAKQSSEAVPTLAIVAEHWAETATAYLQKLTPKTDVKVLGGHLMFWEHSEKFNAIVEEFLKEKVSKL